MGAVIDGYSLDLVPKSTSKRITREFFNFFLDFSRVWSYTEAADDLSHYFPLWGLLGQQ